MKRVINPEFEVRPLVAAIRSRRHRGLAAAILFLAASSYADVALAQDPAAPPATEAVEPIVPPAADVPATESQGAQPEMAPAQATADTATEVAEDSSEMEEVMVTARRREESAQSVPISITAFGSAALEELHIENVDDLATVVPTLSVSSASGRPNAPVYSLRGIRPTEAIYGQDPTVAIYFSDAVLSPAQGSNLGMYDLASVQVLKGPQGTLFGRNTTGGAILLTPKRPGGTFGGDVMVGYGTYGLNETQVGIDLPVTDNFALRLSGRTIDSVGYQTNVAPGPLNGSKLGGETTRSARISAVWNINDSVENYTVFSWDDKRSNGRGTVLQAVNPNNPFMKCYDGPGNPRTGGNPCTTTLASGSVITIESATTPLPSIFAALERAQGRDIHEIESDHQQYDDTDVWGVVNTTTAKLNDSVTLKGIAAYRDFTTNLYFDIDSTAIPGILTSNQTAELRHASYEVQLLGDALDSKLNWVTGLYYYSEDGSEDSPGDTYQGLSIFVNPFMQKGSINNTSYSAFAQGSYSLTPDLSLTAGVRMTKDEKEMTLSTQRPNACQLEDPNADPNAPPIPKLPLDQCSVTLSDSFEQPTGTVSLDYKLRPGVMLYAASRYGYRAGGFNLRAVKQLEYESFDPETVIDFELGTKADWLLADWKMRSNVAVFHQWYDDIQRTVATSNADGTPGSAVQNAAKAKVYGLELEQTIKPTRNLSLQFNYAYTRPKYENWEEDGIDTITKLPTKVDQSGTPFYFTPRHSGSATLSYTQPLGGDAGVLLFAASGSYKSDMWISALLKDTAIKAHPENIRPLLQQEAYWLLDLSSNWSGVMGSKFDIAAYVKNVTDEEYAVGGVQLYTSFGIIGRAYGEPRTYGLQLRYKF